MIESESIATGGVRVAAVHERGQVRAFGHALHQASVELVVHHFLVEQAHGLVPAIVLIAVLVLGLAAMARVEEELQRQHQKRHGR